MISYEPFATQKRIQYLAHACLCGTAFAARNNLYRHERKCKVRANMMGADAVQVPYASTVDQPNFAVVPSTTGVNTNANNKNNNTGSSAGQGHVLQQLRSATDDAWSVQNQLPSSSHASQTSSPSSVSHHANSTSYHHLPPHSAPNRFGVYPPATKACGAPPFLASITPASPSLGPGSTRWTSNSNNSNTSSGRFVTTSSNSGGGSVAGIPALFLPNNNGDGALRVAAAAAAPDSMTVHHQHHQQRHRNVDKHSHEEYAPLSAMTSASSSSPYGRGVAVGPGRGSGEGGGSGSSSTGVSAAGEHYGSSSNVNYGRTSSTGGSPPTRSSSTGTSTTSGPDVANLVELAHVATASSPLFTTAAQVEPATPNTTHATMAAVAFSTVS